MLAGNPTNLPWATNLAATDPQHSDVEEVGGGVADTGGEKEFKREGEGDRCPSWALLSLDRFGQNVELGCR